MAAKLSPKQQEVVDRMTASCEPMVRLSGGFWTLPGCAKANGYQLKQKPDGDTYWEATPTSTYPSWYVSVQTLRALKSRGVLRRAEASNAPDWAKPYELVPVCDLPVPTPRKKRTASNFTAAQKDSVLVCLRAHEAHYLSRSMANPFQRPGVTAMDIAMHLGFTKDGYTKSGRQKLDTPRARRLLKLLIKEGSIESVGSFRTLQAGSKPKECFAPKGFQERRDAAKEPDNAPLDETIIDCAWCGGECLEPFPNTRGEVFCSTNHRTASNRALKKFQRDHDKGGAA